MEIRIQSTPTPIASLKNKTRQDCSHGTLLTIYIYKRIQIYRIVSLAVCMWIGFGISSSTKLVPTWIHKKSYSKSAFCLIYYFFHVLKFHIRLHIYVFFAISWRILVPWYLKFNNIISNLTIPIGNNFHCITQSQIYLPINK
jgi:hypothetical protein